MIVYTGNGPMVFVGLLIVAGLIVPYAALQEWLGPLPFPVLQATILIGLALAGSWCWVLGRRWNKGDNQQHTVYGIPAQYFAFAYWGFGLFLVIAAILHWAD